MGNYVFDTGFLIEQLLLDANDKDSYHDFGKNIIPSLIDNYKVIAFPFRDSDGSQAYWRDVGTLDAYWNANIELIEVVPPLDIYDDTWPVLTNQAQLPPAKFVFNEPNRRGLAIDSMVSGGCIVSGSRLRRSLLFSDVHVHSYSKIEECVVLPEVEIGEYCRIRKAIIDRGAIIPAHTTIGYDHDADRRHGFRVTEQGVVLVTPDMLDQPLHMLS
jgi:glucose-1-phosphate adenylyltransferase